jgi:hypothetical protein
MSEVTSVNGQTGAVVLTATDVGAVPTSAEGQPSGVATLDGSGVLHEAQLPGSVANSSQEDGLAQLKAGLRSVVNITDPKYGCVADSGVTNNRAGIEKAIEDARTLRVPVYAPGAEGKQYGIEGQLTIPDGVDLVGDGGDILHPATEFLCMSQGTNIAFGYTGEGSGPSHGNNPKATGLSGTRGAVSGNFLVNGNNVATQPLLIGNRTQSAFDPICVIKAATWAAYSSGTTYKIGERILYKGFTFVNLIESTGTAPSVTEWVSAQGAGAYPLTTATWQVVTDGVGLVCQYGQNNHFRQVNIQECAGPGIAWDGGWGGGQIDVLEVNECGSAGTWQAMSIQTYSGTPYVVPTKFVVNTAIIERPSKKALGSFLHVAGAQITFHDPIFESKEVEGPFTAVAMVYDGTHTSYDLKIRDAQVQLENGTEISNCFAVMSGCRLNHQCTKANGTGAKYAYLLQEGARVEEERPEWLEEMTLLNPNGTVTTAGAFSTATQARHYAPIELYTLGNPTAQGYITQGGGIGCVNIFIPGTSNAAGGASCIAFGGSSTAPTENPTGAIIFSKTQTLRYRTHQGTIGTFGGNWQIVELKSGTATYRAVEGDVGVIATVVTKVAGIIELPEAKVFGRGIFVVRRTDNAAEATLEVKRQGTDELGKAAENLGTTAIKVGGYEVLRLICDGTSKWYGI